MPDFGIMAKVGLSNCSLFTFTDRKSCLITLINFNFNFNFNALNSFNKIMVTNNLHFTIAYIFVRKHLLLSSN